MAYGLLPAKPVTVHPVLTAARMESGAQKGQLFSCIFLNPGFMVIIPGNFKNPRRAGGHTLPTTVTPSSIDGDKVIAGTISVAVMNLRLSLCACPAISFFGKQRRPQGANYLRVFTEQWLQAHLFLELGHHPPILGNAPGDAEVPLYGHSL